VDRVRYKIQIPLPPRIDPSVTMMQVCSNDVFAIYTVSQKIAPFCFCNNFAKTFDIEINFGKHMPQ